jgi:hypothetical protein
VRGETGYSTPRNSSKRNPDNNVEDFDPVDFTVLSVVSSCAKLAPAWHFLYMKFHSASLQGLYRFRVSLLVPPEKRTANHCQTTLRR